MSRHRRASVQSETGQQGVADIGDLIHSAHQQIVRLFFLQLHDGVEQGALKRKALVNEGIVIAGTLQEQGDLGRDRIMGGLNKGSRLECLFVSFDHAGQEQTGIFEAAVGGAGDDGIGKLFAGLLQTCGRCGDTHFDDPAHSADELGVEEVFILGFDACEAGAGIFYEGDGGLCPGAEGALRRDACC